MVFFVDSAANEHSDFHLTVVWIRYPIQIARDASVSRVDCTYIKPVVVCCAVICIGA